jgi:hypothetical protein
MIQNVPPNDKPEQDSTAPDAVDRAVMDLLARLPLTWAPLDQDKLTAAEQEGLKLLTGGELVERRFSFRLGLLGHTEAVESTITASGDVGLVQAAEPVLKAAWQAFAGEYLKGKAGDEQDQPTFFCQRMGQDEARLTQEGQKAQRHAQKGDTKMLLDYLHRRGPVFAGKVVPGYGKCEMVRIVKLSAAPLQVELVNSGPMAEIAKMMQKVLETQAKTAAAAVTPAGPAAGAPAPVPVPAVAESRCHGMKKNEIAARLLNRTDIKKTRARDAEQKMEACKLRDEGNGKWSIVLDPLVLSQEEIHRLKLTSWPPSPKVK